MPENISDSDGDGFADEGDFIRIFQNQVFIILLQQLALWELK